MNGNDWLTEKRFVDESELLGLEFFAFEVASQAVDNVSFLLLHALDEKKDVEADFEDCSGRANVVITESKVGQTEIRHRFLGVIARLLDTQVVDLDEAAMSFLEELTDLTLRIAHTCVDALCWETHRDYLICHVS